MIHSVASPAASVAESIIALYDDQEHELRQGGAWPHLRMLLSGETGGIVSIPERLKVRSPNDYHMKLITSSIHTLWQRARVVYALDPDMVAELAESVSTTLPGEIFRQLPHTNPLVTFAQPIACTLANGEPGQLLGFYVYGATGLSHERSRRITQTDDPANKSLGIMFVSAVLNSDNERYDWDSLRVSVPLNERFNVAEAIDAVLDNFAMDLAIWDTRREDMTAWLNVMLPLALNILLYLCTENPDMQAVPARKPSKKGKKPRRKEKQTRVLRVGWRLGPALHAARRAAAQARTKMTGTGRSQPPHQRRGHFKTQRYGPGRTEVKIIYVLPYMVRLDLLNSQPLETRVIPVT